MDAKITIRQGHSDDGGFDWARMESDDLSRQQLWNLGEALARVGGLRRISGYEIVHPYVIQQLGMEFAESALRAFVAEHRRLQAEREERRQAEKVRCDCGHMVARNDVMSTSQGTSCPDCYDRMSNY